MYVNFEQRLVYLAHANVASRTTAQVLIDRFGFVRVADHHQGPGGVLTVEADRPNRERWDAEGDPSAFVYFATVRNHFDTLVFWWQDMANFRRHDRIDESFLRSLAEVHPTVLSSPGRLYPFAWGGLPGPYYNLLYENLETELRKILYLHGFSWPAGLVLPYVGRSIGRPRDYRTFYDDKSRALIERVFGEEMELLGYTFENGRTE